MAKDIIVRGETSVIRHIFIQDSTSTTGAGKTALAFDTSSLTAYYIYPGGTATALTLETISTLGTYAAPTSAAHMRFKKIDDTNMPGIYEVQFHNDWFSVASARRGALVQMKGATGMAPVQFEFSLVGTEIANAVWAVADRQLTAFDEDVTTIDINGTTIGTVTTVTNAVTLANGAHGGNAASLTLGAGATISNASGSALTLTSSGGNGHGLLAQGNGTGSGITGSGGATGNGLYVVGDGTGHGAYILSGDGTIAYGMLISSQATLNQRGLYIEDGATITSDNGVGLLVSSTATDTNGMEVAGAGTGGDIVADITGNISGSIGSVTGAVGSVTGNVGGNVAGSVASVTGAVGSVTGAVGSVASGGITAASIATNAIDADALAADAVTEIWAGSTAPTAAAVADAVWDEASTGHTDAGKAGAQVWTDIDAILVDTTEIGAAGAGLTAVPWNASWDAEVQSEVDDALTATVADSVPADGTRPSVAQAVLMLTRFLMERSVSSTTVTVKKEDGSTANMTFTLDSATAPTSITRTT